MDRLKQFTIRFVNVGKHPSLVGDRVRLGSHVPEWVVMGIMLITCTSNIQFGAEDKMKNMLCARFVLPAVITIGSIGMLVQISWLSSAWSKASVPSVQTLPDRINGGVVHVRVRAAEDTSHPVVVEVRASCGAKDLSWKKIEPQDLVRVCSLDATTKIRLNENKDQILIRIQRLDIEAANEGMRQNPPRQVIRCLPPVNHLVPLKGLCS